MLTVATRWTLLIFTFTAWKESSVLKFKYTEVGAFQQCFTKWHTQQQKRRHTIIDLSHCFGINSDSGGPPKNDVPGLLSFGLFYSKKDIFSFDCERSIMQSKKRTMTTSLLPLLDHARTSNDACQERLCRVFSTRLWSSLGQSDLDKEIVSDASLTLQAEDDSNIVSSDDNKKKERNNEATSKDGNSSSGRKLSSYRLMQDLMELASPSWMDGSMITGTAAGQGGSSSTLSMRTTTDTAACKHASHILDRAHNQYFSKNNTSCKPTAAMYTAAINVYGKHGQPEKAEEALFFLWQLYNSTIPDLDNTTDVVGDLELKPNVKTYTAVIDAWGRCNPNMYPNGLKRCEDLLKEMMLLHEHNPTLFPAPNSITFDAVLNAYAQQSQPYCEAQRIPERAEELLEQMDVMKQKGLYKKERKKNEHKDKDDDGLIRPTTHSFTSVITAWAHSRRPEASERSKHILERMIELSKIEPLVTPNTYTFNTVLDSFANAATDNINAADDARNLLDMMERLSRIAPSGQNEGLDHLIESSTILYDSGYVQPDTITYNTVLKAYTNSKANDAAHKADELLSKMRHEYEKNNNTLLRPSDVSFNSVIAAYAKHSNNIESVQRSQALLLQMIDLSKNDPKYKHLQPSVVTFTTVMDAWAKSTVPQKAQNAWLMLQHLKDLYHATGNPALQPNIISYNTVLNACAFSADFDTDERKKALLVAVGAFNELRKQRQNDDVSEMNEEQSTDAALNAKVNSAASNVIPDEVTYGMMLKVCTNLMHMGNQERTIMARKLFEEASEEGYVGSFVLRELKRAVNKRMLLDILIGSAGEPMPSVLFPDGNINPNKLPKSWSRNVLTDRVRGKLRVARMNANINRSRKGGGRKRKQSPSKKKQPLSESESPRAVSRYARTRPRGGESTSIGMDFV